jgi:sodium-dependent dicarboxylate transporter 2/3/5
MSHTNPEVEDDLSEEVPKLGATAERFEAIRQRSGFFLAPLGFALIALTPLPGISPEAHRLAAIFTFTAILWITEAVPISVAALLGPCLCVLLKVAPAKTVFAPFADPVVFLFIGSFIIAKAMFVHGLDRRVAVTVLALPWVGPRPGRIILAFSGVTLLLSMWLSNTATTAMMYPIGLSLLAAFTTSGKGETAASTSGNASRMLLLCAFAASLGGLGTPVGTPPNLIGLGMIRQATSLRISFFYWMLLTVPIMLVLYGVLMLVTGRPARGILPAREALQAWIHGQRERLGKMTAGERNTALAFAVTAGLWVLPGVISLTAGTESAAAKFLEERMPEAVPALIGTTLLFVLPVDWKRRTFTLRWKEAVAIDWGTILLFGGGLSLGGLMFSTGLAKAIGLGLQDWTGAHTVTAMAYLFTVVAIIMTDLTSNTAAANMVIPIAIGLAQGCGVSPVLPALAACLGTSAAFLLPVSTPPNAIVYGSGLVPITHMIRYGFLMDLASAIIIPTVLLLWGPIILPGIAALP